MVEGNELGWTFDTLKRYVDQRFVAADQAIVKAEQQITNRFHTVNEFRGMVSDLSNTMLPRAEYSVQHQALADRIVAQDKRIEVIQLALAELSARDTGKRQGYGAISAVISTAVAMATMVILLLALLLRNGH
jgi:hypothetical protein